MRVLLVVAPFGLIEYPNLATSLLKAEVKAAGFECDLRYATIEFAKRVGFMLYRNLYTVDPPLLIPERIFAHALFGEQIPSWDEYWSEIVIRYEAPLNDRLRTYASKASVSPRLERMQFDAAEFVEDFASDPSMGTYDVIGFSNSYGQNVASLALSKRIKELHPNTRIVFGGANCAGTMGETLMRNFDWIDFICTEDGDECFPELLRRLDSGDSLAVPGIFGRDQLERGERPIPGAMLQDLDSLPLPDFSDYFEAFDFGGDELAEIVAIPMETSRGCWWGQKHHCTFCGLNRESMAYRSKSPERIDQELRALIDRYDMPRIMMTDNIMNRSFVNDTLPLIAENPPHERIFYEVKANVTRDELLSLAKGGVLHLQAGVESLSTKVLGLMDKGVDGFQNLQVLKWAQEYGILISWNVLCGFPGETKDDYDVIAEATPLLHHLQPPLGFSQISIDRFSPLFSRHKDFGIEIQPGRSYEFVYPLPKEEIDNLAYWHTQFSPALDGRISLAPPDYTRGAFQAYLIWRKMNTRADFSYEYIDALGNPVDPSPEARLIVYDTRAVSESSERILGEFERKVFEMLDRRGSASEVVRRLEKAAVIGEAAEPVKEERVEEVLARFRAWSYVYEERDRALVLACRRGIAVATRGSVAPNSAVGTPQVAPHSNG